MDLGKLESPTLLKSLSIKECDSLANEIRELMISSLTKTGGYLENNLSCVELTIGLHRVFNAPKDKILFDASHQSLPHKILTGRGRELSSLRQINGLSSFQLNTESEYDPFSASECGQALSIAYGLAMFETEHHVVVVLSNESLMHGQVFEALNQIGCASKPIIIIYNDNANQMSLNVLSTSLKKIGLVKPLSRFREDMSQFLDKGTGLTRPLKQSIKSLTDSLSKTVGPTNLFTEFGFKYCGPFDGHKLVDILPALEYAKSLNEPVVVHFKTIKGKGYRPVHNEHEGLWVDLNHFDLNRGTHQIELPPNHSKVETELFDQLNFLKSQLVHCVIVNTIREFDSYFDEKAIKLEMSDQHSFSFVSGLALAGKKVVMLIKSEDILRGINKLISEISFMNLDVTMLVFESGLSLIDGGFQGGFFDLPLLLQIPNLQIVQARNHLESRMLLSLAVFNDKPVIMRIHESIGLKTKITHPNFKCCEWEVLNLERKEIKGIILTYGQYVNSFYEKIVKNDLPLWIVNMRFLKPLDEKTLHFIFSFNLPLFIYMEDYDNNLVISSIKEFKNRHEYQAKIETFAYPQTYIGYGQPQMIRKQYQMDSMTVLSEILEKCKD